MLPFLSTTDAARQDEAGSGVSVPPPPRFKPLCGRVTDVSIRQVPSERGNGQTAAQKDGLRYEEKVQKLLCQQFQGYRPSPFVHFSEVHDNGSNIYRTAIPDGILNLPWSCYVFEIKSQHCPEAWWQLDQLYRPILEARNKFRPFACIEVVRSYDPSMPFPCKVDLLDVNDIITYRGGFGVVICRI